MHLIAKDQGLKTKDCNAMRFIKDILLFELETTGGDVERDVVIQLAAVLLDKDNLLEKGLFNSYVRTSFLDDTLTRHGALLHVSLDILKKSSKTLDVVRSFVSQFSSEVQLGVQSPRNFIFLRNMFRKVNIPFEYDFHVLDIWTLQYMYVQKLGLKKMPTLHTLMDTFKLKQKNPHNALERARLQTEVLRKIISR